MRVKDQKRFIIAVQYLCKQAKERGVIDLTDACVQVDFSIYNAEVLKLRYEQYGKMLKQVGVFAAEARDLELVAKVTALARSVNCGRVKRIRNDRD